MNTGDDARPTLAVYLENLTIQLRLLEVPGDRIGQILAEVETHVADTGLDPVDAFGEPGEYVATCVAQAPASRERGWLSELGIAGVSVTACSAAVEGVVHLAGSVELTVRLLGTWLATVAVGLVVVHLLFALLARETAGSAKQRTFTSQYMVLWVLAWLAAVAVLVLIPLLLPTGPTMLSVPGWVLVVAGLLAMFALVRHLGGDRVVDPRGCADVGGIPIWMLSTQAVALTTVPGLFRAREHDEIRIAFHQGPAWATIKLKPPAGQSESSLFCGCAGKCRGEHLVQAPEPHGS